MKSFVICTPRKKYFIEQIKMDEVGRAWGKQDKYLEVFGGNAGIKYDSSCGQEQDKMDILYIG